MCVCVCTYVCVSVCVSMCVDDCVRMEVCLGVCLCVFVHVTWHKGRVREWRGLLTLKGDLLPVGKENPRGVLPW